MVRWLAAIAPLAAVAAIACSASTAQAATTRVVVSEHPYFVPFLTGQHAVVDFAHNGGFTFPFTPDFSTVTVTVPPSGGSLARTATGFDYDASPGAARADNFEYEICSAPVNGTAQCQTVLVYIEPLLLPAFVPVASSPVRPPVAVVSQSAGIAVPPGYRLAITAVPPTTVAPTTPPSEPSVSAQETAGSLAFTGANGLVAFVAALALFEGFVLCSATRVHSLT